MKKFVKPLVIAASVAAVAGIGAVSFASWTGTMEHETTGLKSAQINTIGLTATDPTTALLPYDQVGTYSSAETMWNIELTVSNDVAGYKITATVEAEGIDGSGSGVYVKLDKSSTATAPTSDSDAAGAWKVEELDTDGSGTYYAHVVLVSNDTGDMNQDITITFELVEA